jgi:hypothetical protein
MPTKTQNKINGLEMRVRKGVKNPDTACGREKRLRRVEIA